MNPLSGSNRVPLSPRRTSSFLPASSSTSTPISTYTPSFALPSYLRHSSYSSRFITTPTSSPSAPDSIPLPTSWDPLDKCALLELSSNSLECSFRGSAKYGDRDAAAVRANQCVPTETGVWYFEVEVLNKGVSGYIGIGLSHRSVSLSRLPGWESLSYGYHADDGRAFCSQGTGEPFGPTFTTGDVVGCGIDWTDAGGERGKRERDAGRKDARKGKEKEKGASGGRVFYTKNGTFIGYAFSGVSGQLYPTIGLRTPNESIRVNFGQKPFKFDIESLLLDRKRVILSRISTLPLTPNYFLPSSLAPQPPIPTLVPSTIAAPFNAEHKARDNLHESLQELIGEYLSHCGYDQTATSFRSQVKRERIDRGEGLIPNSAPRLEEVVEEEEGKGGRKEGSSAELRGRILGLASQDRTREALEMVQEHYPAVFVEEGEEGDRKDREELVFRLRCRVFVEAVLEYSRSETLSTPVDLKGKIKPPQEDHEMDSSSPSSTITIDLLLLLGRELHSLYSSHSSASIQATLQSTLGLMAYQNPLAQVQAGTESHALVTGADRDALVERLNRAILKASGLPPIPTLELMFRQSWAVVGMASELGSGGAALVDVRREVMGEGE